MIVVHLLIFLRLADQVAYLDQDYIDTTKKIVETNALFHQITTFIKVHVAFVFGI